MSKNAAIMKKKSHDLSFISVIIILLIMGCTNSTHKVYYPTSGKLLAEYGMENGKRNGIQKSYYESGTLKEEYEMVDDSLTGMYKKYYESGNLKVECNELNGKLQGKSLAYYQNGKLQAEVTFINGSRNGPFKTYDENGALLNDGRFKNDKQDSLIYTYYPNGNVKKKFFSKEGVAEGPYQIYLKNGKMEVGGIYHNDTTVYYNRYNEAGDLVEKYRDLKVIPERDTISLGSTYSGKIVIYGPNPDEVLLKIGLINRNEHKGVKGLKEIPQTGSDATFSVLPNKVGEWSLDIKMFSKGNPEVQMEEMIHFFVRKK
jgi:antitoxin component YwqK of YwqJK toxin-antitoxin module